MRWITNAPTRAGMFVTLSYPRNTVRLLQVFTDGSKRWMDKQEDRRDCFDYITHSCRIPPKPVSK